MSNESQQSFIPYGRQHISDDDIAAVTDVLRSDFITQGPAIAAFEKNVADYCGVKYAVAVSNASAGLHMAAQASGLTQGQMLWTVPNTFVASANAGLHCGASVDFVDIDPVSYNLSVDDLKRKLEAGEKPDVLIPVHFSGQSCEMDAIHQLSEQYGFTVIEDAAHAIGAQYNGEPVGNCRYSDMCVFSFHPVKIITTGEGGMITTNDDVLYQTLLQLRTLGITRDPSLMSKEPDGPWYYEQLALGQNYRMTDIQAALGNSQMSRLDDFVKQRRKLAARYDTLLADLPLSVPKQHSDTHSSWHLYVIQLDDPSIRKSTFEALRAADIGVNVHYIPVHYQPVYQKLGFKSGDFKNSENYYSRAITLPLYPALTHAEQDRVVETLKSILCGVPTS